MLNPQAGQPLYLQLMQQIRHAVEAGVWSAGDLASCEKRSLTKCCDNNAVIIRKERAMTVTIQPEHERLIADAIQTGAYKSPEDVIGRALEVLHAEEEWLAENRLEIHEKIERAFGQFERGEFFTPNQSRADMEKRKAEWLHGQQG
jgi:Arc/MetJ-type ribon-helix-helix transcriptional regulator